MGSGFVMNSYVLKALKNLNAEEANEALEALGLNYLVDTFGYDSYEDFQTTSKRGAELVRLAVFRDFENQFGKDYPFSVDVVEDQGVFKVSFFK